MSNATDIPRPAPALEALVAEIEERCRTAALDCAELRALTAGTKPFGRVASLARLLEETQHDVDRLRAGVEGYGTRPDRRP